MIPSIKRFRYALYGTSEYEKILNENKELIKLHFFKNDHHPEHFEDYRSMSLLALIEMFADWKAAIKKQPNGNIEKSFEVAQKKYGMSNEILKFLKTLE